MPRTYTVGVVLFLFVSCLQAECDVVLNEVLANPSGNESSDEAVEIYNAGPVPVDVAGWKILEPLGDELNDTITDFIGVFDAGQPGTILEPGWFAVIVDSTYMGAHNLQLGDPAKFIMVQATGDSTIGNSLANSSDDIGLDDNAGCQSSFVWPSDAGQGVSWEKIDPHGPEETSNWAPNSANQHTLGSPNRPLLLNPPVSVQALTASFLEVLPPNPFTPYETLNNQGQIGFNTPPGSFKTIRIFDVQGHEILKLVDKDQVRNGGSLSGTAQGVVAWDGRDENNIIVPMGIYVVHLQAEDSAGNVLQKKTDTIVVGRRL